jgi:hypothetical protein
MVKTGEHGTRFVYLTPNTDVLAWLLKRLTGKTLAALMEEYIWTKIGAERDAYWIVEASTAETAGSGLVTTVRDMARFGQMLLQKGWYNGQQIIHPQVVADIEQGADWEAFARGPAASPGNRGYSYHHQWWVTHNAFGAYQALGFGGQILYTHRGLIWWWQSSAHTRHRRLPGRSFTALSPPYRRWRKHSLNKPIRWLETTLPLRTSTSPPKHCDGLVFHSMLDYSERKYATRSRICASLNLCRYTSGITLL